MTTTFKTERSAMPTAHTLLERLDAAEANLARAEHALREARRQHLGTKRDAELDLIAATAHAQITAARCIVSVEELPEG